MVQLASRFSLACFLTLLAAFPAAANGWGAQANGAGVSVRLYSEHATRIELCLFAEAHGESERLRLPMTRGANNAWAIQVSAAQLQAANLPSRPLYGFRAWGPNWTFDPAWIPGSGAGFVADVDAQGNRFNPNKLLFDPYAREITHDPINARFSDGAAFASGPKRTYDTAKVAPKGVIVPDAGGSSGPSRPFKDDVVYEVHLRGFTMNDPSVPADERGTYAGAARKASYLKELGITAVEFLPLHETDNDQNDLDPTSTAGDNYWGYANLSYFAPDRRYAKDKRPGGPTRELKAMIAAFHAQGIKVILDVVYNHTGEGYLWAGDPSKANVLSYRGIDNQTYYQLSPDRRFYWDNTGCGGNFNCAHPVVRDLIIDSLRYWHEQLGIDAFRFDLASVLGNKRTAPGFEFDKFDPNNVLNRAVRELPNAQMIAEPWAIGAGTYQVGNFPAGWAEWNGEFRDTVRRFQNSDSVNLGDLAHRLGGSDGMFKDDGRKPWHSVNFLVAHDGFTLADLYRFNHKHNDQPWPYGPSDGGHDHNDSWDQGGDPVAQRQAARMGMAILALSQGVPMITGGDEFLRSQNGNNNVYNLDSIKNWLDWEQGAREHAKFTDFTRRMLKLRAQYPSLRRAEFFTGRDNDQNGLKDIQWLSTNGEVPVGDWTNPAMRFIAYRIDGEEAGDPTRSLYVAINGAANKVTTTLPDPAPGHSWFRVVDTAPWYEDEGNAAKAGTATRLDGRTYELHERTVLVLVEAPSGSTQPVGPAGSPSGSSSGATGSGSSTGPAVGGIAPAVGGTSGN